MSGESVAVAVGLLLRDRHVLMGERPPEKVYPLYWEFPGGKVETGETAKAALFRELREELAIEVEDAEEWFSEVADYTHGRYAITFFLVREWYGEIENREFNEIRWFSIETLRTLKHLAGNQRILARLEREGIPA